ncbi:SPL family radical SAM protein [Kosmotoga olearia]|uniref:Radical SAM domain protein n=1 Tax=Kosmotoga olearia (strain ATCC BAA-1733 / DSM 21960 / TBF 19.5.1) TaxID=521045 RepID=C5CI02_KOSOT|nr:radical SAM protein [Kosmotoga olearia]ACR79781.1 Radical SAM domain protein [Kosmotoga olearia TBF 19.5.1]
MIKEICAKKAVTRTKIPVARYTVNPYIGCTFGCRYCFARFIGAFKYTSGTWGKDILVRKNIPELLRKEINKLSPGKFFLSTSCDPYQHIEKKYEITRTVIRILLSHWMPIFIMTKSSLIRRDIDLLMLEVDLEVNITITTDREDVRKLLEPGAPSIQERLETIKFLKEKGIKVGAFVGPVLPMNPEKLALKLSRLIERVHLDPLNYPGQVKNIYIKNGWNKWLHKDSFYEVREVFEKIFGSENVG